MAALRGRRGADAWRRCEAVRRLVVVCASSRGGSSLFGEVLRGLPGLLHTSAEINPHFVIPTLDRFHVDLVAGRTSHRPGRGETLGRGGDGGGWRRVAGDDVPGRAAAGAARAPVPRPARL
ncbi:MAG: hypothetical protein ACRDYA_12875 [Egibacteraceae bacterium]